MTHQEPDYFREKASENRNSWAEADVKQISLRVPVDAVELVRTVCGMLLGEHLLRAAESKPHLASTLADKRPCQVPTIFNIEALHGDEEGAEPNKEVTALGEALERLEQVKRDGRAAKSNYDVERMIHAFAMELGLSYYIKGEYDRLAAGLPKLK